MLNRRHLFVAALAAAPALAAGDAFAQGQATVGLSTTTTYTIEGRIAAADPTARSVTLTMADGSSRTFKVSPAVATLSSTKIGDTVAVGIEEKRTFVLSGPNIKTPGDRSTTVTAVGRMGNTVGGVAADKSVMTWWVTAVNVAGNTISWLIRAADRSRTFSVDSTAGRENLSRVKPGDNLTAISSDIVAVSLTPKS